MAFRNQQKLSLLAQFDDLCRISKTLFDLDDDDRDSGDDDDITKFLSQVECNRISWLETKRELTQANDTIGKLRAEKDELEIKLARLRQAFAAEMHKNDDKEKECAKLRQVMELIRECVTDQRRFDKELNARVRSKNGLITTSSSSSSNSDYHSGSYRDLMLSILDNSSNENAKTKVSSTYRVTPESKKMNKLNGSIDSLTENDDQDDDDELLFDKTENSLHVSPLKDTEGDYNEKRYMFGMKRPISAAAISSDSSINLIVDNNYHRESKIEHHDNDAAAFRAKQSRVSHNSNNDYDDDAHRDNISAKTYTIQNEFEMNREMIQNDANEDDDKTMYLTPNVIRHSPNAAGSNIIIRPMVSDVDYRRHLIRAASARKVKVDLSRLDNRPHRLAAKKAFKPMNCVPCGRAIGFVSRCLVCIDCHTVSHVTCERQLALPCIPHFTPKAAARGNSNVPLLINDFVSLDARPFVPPLLVHCCNEIERRAANEEGVYRKCGSDREIRELKSKFLRTKTGAPNIRETDIHVLCGAVKMFLRELDDPLITRVLWHDFVRASDISSHGREKSIALLKRSIDQLPDPNRDTIAFLLCHLQRIVELQSSPSTSSLSNTTITVMNGNRMTIESLAKIFAPTIIGHSTANPISCVMSENRKQIRTLSALLDLPNDYWRETLREPDIYKTPSRSLNQNGGLRKFATTGSKARAAAAANDALSPLSYRSATSSIYGTPAAGAISGGVSRFTPISPRNLFPQLQQLV